MTAEVGRAALFVGLASSLWSLAAAAQAVRSGQARYVDSARRGFYALAGLLVFAFLLLEAAYLRSDFSVALVAQNSSLATPLFYRLTAVWSSQAGSLLFWVLVLSLYSSAALRGTRTSQRQLAPHAMLVLGSIAAFFLVLLLVYAEPFARLAPLPPDGNGLNPLLRNPMMIAHPPMLYAGYVGFSIPFAFCIAALVTRRTDAAWLRATRRFTLVAWTFLGVGLLLGSLWSYAELGWGGYWGWDPVENAALMPWLVATAFLHSIQIQERRGMLRIWNVSLIIATFILALLGTFLVRSGVLSSIHAFGASTLGKPFLAFIAVALLGSVLLVTSRLDDLRSRGSIQSLASREAIFLLNNLVLVSLCFVIFWGTFFPLISELVTGDKASVGPPWFDRYTAPLGIALVALTALGPLLGWRQMHAAQLRVVLARPLTAAVVAALVASLTTPALSSPRSLALFAAAAMVAATVAQEFARAMSARRALTGERRPVALLRVSARNRRRYGGYVVHLGIAVLLFGVAASSAFQRRADLRLQPGQSARVGGWTVRYLRPTVRIASDPSGTGAPIVLGALLDARRGGEHVRLNPARNYYPTADDGTLGAVGRFFDGEATSEVSASWGVRRDLWSAVQPDLSGLGPAIARANREFATSRPNVQALVIAAIAKAYAARSGRPTLRVIVFPFVSSIWLGGALAVLGALFALAAGRHPRRVRARASAAIVQPSA